MKKSMVYWMAMAAVIEEKGMTPGQKIDILEVLMADRRIALYSEEEEGKK